MTEPRPRRLWHYCCDHSVAGIVRADEIRPNPHAGFQPGVSGATGARIVALPVIWLSDLDVATEADVEALGLGANTGIVTCDRVAYRFRVPATSGAWWPAWADGALERGQITEGWRTLLELGRASERWWVSERPIRSPRLDERYGRPVATGAGS